MIRTKTAEVLNCFDSEFADVAAAFARGEYLLWLGSGLSRGVVPGVPVLLKRMLEFLRASIDTKDTACRFRTALEEVLDVAGVPAGTLASIDLAQPVDQWLELDDIIGRLLDKYSDVLDVQVKGEAEDFLVWTGLNVPVTYGAAGLEPDVEHHCVAILMMEGVVRSAPSTNWDGLVEAALLRIADNADAVLRVIVRPMDFREPDRQAELVKFHGCAVRALADEAEYRPLLIARKAQISGWTTKQENQLMKNHLEHLFASRPALIIGLSAQDADIHTMLHTASRDLDRKWPTAPPAVVFAEQQLGYHHRHVMKVTYGDTYAPNADAIGESALLGAYAKPVLLGLVLFTLADKLCTLAACVPGPLQSGMGIASIQSGIRDLRDRVGQLADKDPRAFTEALVSLMAITLSTFRHGRIPAPSEVRYQPISNAPISRALTSPDFPAPELGRLAVAVSVLGRGVSEGRWRLDVGSPASPSDGVLRVAAGRQVSCLFMVRDSRALAQLEMDGVVDPSDERVLVIHAQSVRRPTTRSPRARYGRTGRGGARSIDLERILGTVCTADELFEAFRLEGGLS